MHPDPTDPSYLTAEQLGGPNYEAMTLGQDAAMGYLSARDERVRLAAIMVCVTRWGCGRDSRVLEACRALAGSEAEDPIRVCALSLLGMVLGSTTEREASRFLARLIMDPANSTSVRTEAYWALREIQFSASDVTTDTMDAFFKGLVYRMKKYLRAYPERFSEASVKANLVPAPPLGGFPEDFWESADQIDLEFVRRFV